MQTIDLPQGNIAIEGKRDSVHKLCRIRYKRKQSNTKELLVNARAL